MNAVDAVAFRHAARVEWGLAATIWTMNVGAI
jgi:hypothetical protein